MEPDSKFYTKVFAVIALFMIASVTSRESHSDYLEYQKADACIKAGKAWVVTARVPSKTQQPVLIGCMVKSQSAAE